MASPRKNQIKRTVQYRNHEPSNSISKGSSAATLSRYSYSDTFDDHLPSQTYSDTFISDSYSDTFMTGSTSTGTGRGTNKNSSESDNIITQISVRKSANSSEIQELTNLETARNITEMLETVIELESDTSITTGVTGTVRTFYDQTTYPSELHTYSDTFESSELTKVESVASDSFSDRSYSEYTKSLLDYSYVAPDYNGKSLTDEEDEKNEADTFNDEYSYIFEPTEVTSYTQLDSELAKQEAEQFNLGEQAKKQFVKGLLARLQSRPGRDFVKLETIPAEREEDEDEYLRHYCKKKIKMLKRKKESQQGDKDTTGQKQTDVPNSLLSDYGVPESVLERAKLRKLMSAMEKAGKEKIHEPSKCKQCRELKLQLDAEEAEKNFVTAHAKRLKNKMMDTKVEEHLLKMNSISMIAELARDLPKASEKPEKILDRLFEPLLGKNVMR